MKITLLIFAFLINTPNQSLGNDISNAHASFEEKNKIENVFFTDDENQLLFIDFLGISSNVMAVKILQNGSEILIEDVSELDQDMIYEIDLTILPHGEYTIKVFAENGTTIENTFTVK